jgi:uncharacterized protein YndB with AHSA1/START domain
LTLKQQTTTIKQKIVIPASSKQVYEAYTNPKLHSEFTDSPATGKPVVGGKFTAWDGYIFGVYLELEEGKRLVQEWTTTDWAEGYGPSKLELTFREVKGGTEIVLIQTGVPKEQADEIEEGWIDFYWNPLKEYFKNQNLKD